MVGTTNRSIAAMSGAWLCRKVRHRGLGGPRRLTMYLATLDCATANPSLSSSPRMRGAPQSGFSTLIERISLRSSASIWGRPPGRARLPTPVTVKARPMPTQERLGTDDRENLQNRRKPAIHLDKEPAVVVCEPDAAAQSTPQNNQLMSKYRILRLRPALRPERQGQNGQYEMQKPEHPASLRDSVTSSTQITFSVHSRSLLST